MEDRESSLADDLRAARALIDTPAAWENRPHIGDTTAMSIEYIVILQQAWMNDSGFGINYGWDGERFPTLKKAIKHGWAIRGSDDFNIAHVEGDRLVWFGWMDEPIDESAEEMRVIADEVGLEYGASP